MKFAVVGGDRRSALLCALLSRDGHKVYSFALEKAELPGGGAPGGLPAGLRLRRGLRNTAGASRKRRALEQPPFLGDTENAGAYRRPLERTDPLRRKIQRRQLHGGHKGETASGGHHAKAGFRGWQRGADGGRGS